MTSNKIHRVERGGEVQPDRTNKGSDASISAAMEGQSIAANAPAKLEWQRLPVS